MKGKTYEYSATQVSSTEVEPQIIEMVLTQLTLKAAMNKRCYICCRGRDETTILEKYVQASRLE